MEARSRWLYCLIELNWRITRTWEIMQLFCFCDGGLIAVGFQNIIFLEGEVSWRLVISIKSVTLSGTRLEHLHTLLFHLLLYLDVSFFRNHLGYGQEPVSLCTRWTRAHGRNMSRVIAHSGDWRNQLFLTNEMPFLSFYLTVHGMEIWVERLDRSKNQFSRWFHVWVRFSPGRFYPGSMQTESKRRKKNIKHKRAAWLVSSR